MTLPEVTNASVRFILELLALLAFGYWGFEAISDAVLEWVAGLGAPAAFALVWGMYISPKAPMRLGDPARVLGEMAVFGLAALALADAGESVLAVAFALAVATNIALMFFLDQRRTI